MQPLGMQLWPLLAALLATASATSSTLNKCCPTGQSIDEKIVSCTPSSAAQDQFQNETLIYQKKSAGPFNVPCPSEESDALVLNSMDMNFTVDMDTLELVPGKVNGVERFLPGEFCLDEVFANNKTTVYWIAITCPCLRGVCIRTCCGKNKILKTSLTESVDDGKAESCVDASETNARGEEHNWDPLSKAEDSKIGYYKLEALPKCKSLFHDELLNFTITKNGTLKHYDMGELYTSSLNGSDYCIGLAEINNTTSRENDIVPVFLQCHMATEGQDKGRIFIYVALFSIGAVFLLATIVVHLALPALTKGVRGKGLVAHCSLMFVAHIALIVVYLEGSHLSDIPCKVLAYLIQYTLLAGFFWLNVLCIDISMTFRSLQSMVPRGMLSERKQFAWYTAYALAIPFVIFVTTVSLNEVYSRQENKTVKYLLPDPGIGSSSCWFVKDSTAILIFFYGPIGILLLINLFLFAFTTYKICKLSRAANMINQNDNSQRHNPEHKRFVLFLKLFGLMGIPWVFEIISWAIGGENWYWYFTDSVNLLRSIFIFTTFCWKKKVWKLLSERYPRFKKFALMIRSESPGTTDRSRSNPSNNESFADTMYAVSLDTLAMDLPVRAQINQ